MTSAFALWQNSYHSNSKLQLGRVMLVRDIALFVLSSSRISSALWISQSPCTSRDTLQSQIRCEEFLYFLTLKDRSSLISPFLFLIKPHVISWNIKTERFWDCEEQCCSRCFHCTLIIFILLFLHLLFLCSFADKNMQSIA